jgi:hypothetical protein
MGTTGGLLVLRRITCVVGVLTKAEAAAAVGLLNGQRWVSRQEGKGKEKTTHVLRSYDLYLVR